MTSTSSLGLLIELHIPEDSGRYPYNLYQESSWKKAEVPLRKENIKYQSFLSEEINGYKHHNYIECHTTEANWVFSLAPISAVRRLEAQKSYFILGDFPMNGNGKLTDLLYCV